MTNTTSVDSFGVHYVEAIAAFQAKVNLTSKRWDEFMGPIHARAFTIAGATKADLVGDMHSAISDALKTGKTITNFRKEFDAIVQKHGWSYKGSRGWRTQMIYNTNMRTARMAGRWQQIERSRNRRPYIQYVVVDDTRLRPAHRAWKAVILPVDDKFWDTHYPPNGWGCRCTVKTLSQRDMDRKGLTVSESPEIERSPRVNTRTGEYYGEVPNGIDSGWDYNVGKASLGADIALGQKIMKLPQPSRATILNSRETYADKIQPSWTQWLKVIGANKRPRGYSHSVGVLPESSIAAIEAKGIEVNSALMVVTDDNLDKLFKERGKRSKGKGKTRSGIRVPEAWLKRLPKLIANYQAILYDHDNNGLVFVLNQKTQDRKGKVVVEFNMKRRRAGSLPFNKVKSLSAVKLEDYNSGNYEVIEGNLK